MKVINCKLNLLLKQQNLHKQKITLNKSCFNEDIRIINKPINFPNNYFIKFLNFHALKKVNINNINNN